MLPILLALSLSQTPAAVRRSTPLVDDPGMVVRNIPSGTQNVNVIGGGGVSVMPDGGLIGSVMQAGGLDGGAWAVQGIGAAGTPNGGIVSVQGVVGGTALPISGSITATNPSVGTTGAVVPTSATTIGGSDGTNLQVPYVVTATPGASDPGLVVRVVGGSGSGGTVNQGVALDGGVAWATNVTHVGSTLVTTGSGASSTGTQRVILATDQPAIPVNDNGGSITVDGTVTANAGSGTFAVSAAALPLPTGAATAANQTTLNTQTTKLNDGTDTALITAAGALVVDGSGSTQPVSGAVAATQSGAWNITNVSGTVSLPTGASTAALQTTGNTSLSNIDTKTPALGQTTMASSTPVVIASNQSTVPVSAASLPLPTGAATEVTLASRLAETTFTGRFPGASLLADNTANPTLSAVASFGLVWDGSTWDRMAGNSADGLLVNLGTNNDVSLNAGTNYVGRVRPTDGTLDLSLLNSAPGSDTGQVSIPVRVISSLAGGAGGTSSSFTAAFPASGTASGFSDGTNMQGARVFDLDTGAGSQYALGMNLRVAASGGSTEAATGAGVVSASTLRVVLPTDQTAIPITDNGGSVTVDGTVTANQGGTWNLNNISGTVSLPTGAATEVTLASRLADSTFTGRFLAAAAAADNTANPTTTGTLGFNMLWDGATWDRQPGNSTDGTLVNLGTNNDVTVTGTVTANAGSGTFATNLTQMNGTAVTTGSGVLGAGTQRVVLATDQPAVTVAQATAANLRTQTSSEGATGSAAPANAAYVGFQQSGATTLRPGLAVDVDTSGSAIYAQGVAIVGGSFGAPVQASVDAVAIIGTSTGLVTREVLKTATSVVSTSVTCATSATAAPASTLTNRHSICIYNNGSNTVFVGPTSVTTSNGFPVPPGGSFCDDVNTTQVYSCIVGSGTENVRVLEN